MVPARRRRTAAGFPSLQLLVILLVLPCLAAANVIPQEESPSPDTTTDAMTDTTDDMTDTTDAMTDTTDDATDTTDDVTDKTDDATDTTDDVTDKTDDVTDKTDDATDTTDDTTDVTDDTTDETDDTTDVTDDMTDVTDDMTDETEETEQTEEPTDKPTEKPTDKPTDEPTNKPTDTPTEGPPTTDLDLYKETRNELRNTSETLDNFKKLIEVPKENTRLGGDSNPIKMKLMRQYNQANNNNNKEDEDEEANMCKEPEGTLCNELEANLNQTKQLVDKMNKGLDWTVDDLYALRQKNADLNDIYNQASESTETFEESINLIPFLNAVDNVKEVVTNGITKMDNEINRIEREQAGSVALVAVVGSIGGLMIVSVLGTMVYGAVQKKKLKKNRTDSTQYNKLQGENIPIDGFLSDTSSASPTAHQQANRLDPYAFDQYQPKSGPQTNRGFSGDSDYRGVSIPRVGQGLPRTQHY